MLTSISENEPPQRGGRSRRAQPGARAASVHGAAQRDALCGGSLAGFEVIRRVSAVVQAHEFVEPRHEELEDRRRVRFAVADGYLDGWRFAFERSADDRRRQQVL